MKHLSAHISSWLNRQKVLLRDSAPDAIHRMRLKLTAAAFATTSLVLTLVLVGMNLMSWQELCNRVDGVIDLIEDAGGVLGNLDINNIDAPPSRSIAWEALQEISYDARYFTVTFDEHGETLRTDLSSIASVDEPSARDMAQEVMNHSQQTGFYGNYRYRIAPTKDGSMVIFFYCYDDLNYFRAFQHTSILMGVLGLIAFAAIVIPFSRVATRPVQEAQRRQRRFVTDASHELRTPIAIISSATDVIEIESGSSEWTQSIHNQAHRLEDLTNKLLALAKADEGGRSLTKVELDVSQLVLSRAEDFEAVSLASQKPLECDVQTQVTYFANRSMIEQVVTILLDNAFKHSSEHAQVLLSLSGGNQHVTLKLTNDVENMAPGEHPELFGRFYRSDSSRSFSGGHGIGLAVVRAVAEAHGGSVRAYCKDNRLSVEFKI